MPKYYDQREIESLPTRDLLRDLLRSPLALSGLKGQEQPFESLLAALLAWENPDQPPTLAVLQQRAHLKPARFRPTLELLYQAFLDALAAEETVIRCPQVTHCFIIPGQRQNQLVWCELTRVPSVGENVELDFLSAITRHDSYFVESITSEYQEGKTTVYLQLAAGRYDPYYQLLLARARFENKLTHSLERQLDDEQLRAWLQSAYGVTKASAPVPDLPVRRSHKHS
ncbi:hypothetical protein LGH70_22480 [Hymenobacter sp. BT635]|uniref:Uncharacterized protein n=2 Tax=Hymenobacter TaxID=89966 RepID=A0A428JXY1_9BACT|nr:MULTISPECIES: hypothetical protein [Hymenobacter]MCB2380376.1 hypothetical protein [Hymenobacter nitidus]RSK39001.1 hypothetical protein EI293_20990 [Hymenobacter perfusus]